MKQLISILLTLIICKAQAQIFKHDSTYGINGIARLQSSSANNILNSTNWGDGFIVLPNQKTIALHVNDYSLLPNQPQTHGVI